ncbi:uncharacterized protein METZ01_LOCUS323159, partial [marine metagenome]
MAASEIRTLGPRNFWQLVQPNPGEIPYKNAKKQVAHETQEGLSMFTATDGVLIPTTVTGSWPRPGWFTRSLGGQRLSDAMTDITYREQYLDAVAAVISDQEQTGLDIVTNGDYHLDPNLGGLS